LLQPALVVAPDRLAIDARDAGDLALRCVALQQCLYGGALVGLQDIHSLAFLGEDRINVLPTGADDAGV
jgi:hypothetical protein